MKDYKGRKVTEGWKRPEADQKRIKVEIAEQGRKDRGKCWRILAFRGFLSKFRGRERARGSAKRRFRGDNGEKSHNRDLEVGGGSQMPEGRRRTKGERDEGFPCVSKKTKAKPQQRGGEKQHWWYREGEDVANAPFRWKGKGWMKTRFSTRMIFKHQGKGLGKQDTPAMRTDIRAGRSGRGEVIVDLCST